MTHSIKPLTKAALAQFTGTSQWYRHSLVRSILYTEGAQFLAEAGGAYWLLDEIAIPQMTEKRVAGEKFQTWRLSVRRDSTARLTCGDGRGTTIYAKEIAFTDFPLGDVTLFFTDKVIMLPSEY